MRIFHPRLLATLAAGIAVLALDSVTPRAVSTWLLQVAVVWYALRWASRRELLVVGLWCAACADIGYWVSPSSGLSVRLGIVNQLLCIGSILLLVQSGLKRLKAEAEVRQLRGLLPICAECKRIKNEAGEWEQFEVYIRRHSNADFTHGLCSDCGAAFDEA